MQKKQIIIKKFVINIKYIKKIDNQIIKFDYDYKIYLYFFN